MIELIQRWLDLASELTGRQPVLALCLGAAMAAVLLTRLLGGRRDEEAGRTVGWAIFAAARRIAWAVTVTVLIGWAANAMQGMLSQNEQSFRHDHGRVTEVNLAALRTIWGEEQVQGELTVKLYYETEEIERLESEDPTRPTVTRKKKIRHDITANPFVSARHSMTLAPSERQKGNARYAGYTTQCAFTYELVNPDNHEAKAEMRFPLPSRSAVYNDLVVQLDGKDMLGQIRMQDGAVVLEVPASAGQRMKLQIAFRSRGLMTWYFVVREQREIRDFVLTLTVPTLPLERWNNPEGCMTPSTLQRTADRLGTEATYTLDRAIASKGMGVALPKVRQPGALEAQVIGQARTGWVLMFAVSVLGLVLAGARLAELSAVLIGAAVAVAWGLVGTLFDTPLGFWLGAIIVLVPLLLLISAAVRRAMPGRPGLVLSAAIAVFALAYPLLAAIDQPRDMLHLNLSAGLFVAIAAWMVLRAKPAGT